MLNRNEAVGRIVGRGGRALASAGIIWMLTACGPAPAASPSAAEPGRGYIAEPRAQWYPELRAYYNKDLPVSLVKKIATDMTNLTEYPSLVSSGKLLLEQYDNPEKSQGLLPYPLVTNPFPMSISFSDKIPPTIRGKFTIVSDNVPQQLVLLEKATGKELRLTGTKTHSQKFMIALNSFLQDANASEWAYRVILAKEASHPFYMHQQVEDVWNAVNQKYDVMGGEAMKPILYRTAHSPHQELPTPILSLPHFDRAADFLNYAGYWHINADVQSLSREGKLTQQDRNMLEAAIAISDLSLRKGLLILNNRGGFDWKEGIGPFSDEWIAVVDAVPLAIRK